MPGKVTVNKHAEEFGGINFTDVSIVNLYFRFNARPRTMFISEDHKISLSNI